jgi:hypothetical protein
LNRGNGANSMNKFNVLVIWKGGGAPAGMTGRFMFSAAPTAPDQSAASPFRNVTGNKQLCYFEQSEVKGVSDTATGETRYTFTELPVDQNADEGKYELTFVAESEQPLGTLTGTQWSEDPEFDVDG